MTGPTNTRQLHFGHALLPGGWHQDVRIGIRAGRIASIETGVPFETTDERHPVGMPGVPNLHSHAFQRSMAGFAEAQGLGADSFWTWRDAMYRFVDRIGPDELRAITALAYMEMLESGFTRVGEFHYLHHDRAGQPYADPGEMGGAIVDAAAETGIALTLLPVFYAHADFGDVAPNHGQRRFVHDVDAFARLIEALAAPVASLPGGVLGVAAHSLRAVTATELVAVTALRPDQPVHIHIAEQTREVDDCLAWSGARPVEWLLDHADVGRRWCLVHATHVTGEELAAVAASGAVVGLCPITEANLGDGIFPASSYQAQGGCYGVGSDSNVLIDMTEELRLLEYSQRLADRGRNRLAGGAGKSTGQSLYDAAVSGGGRALGIEAGLVIGGFADIVSVDTGHVSFVGKSVAQLLDSLIFAVGRAGIDRVWRAGEDVVRAGKHRHRARIVERYERLCSAMLE